MTSTLQIDVANTTFAKSPLLLPRLDDYASTTGAAYDEYGIVDAMRFTHRREISTGVPDAWALDHQSQI